MSDFKAALDVVREHHENKIEALNNKEARKWSTSDDTAYQALMEKFNTDEQNSEAVSLYEKSKKGAGGAISDQMAFRTQIQIMAAIRRAYRMKMVTSNDLTAYNPIEAARHEILNRQAAAGKLERIKKNKGVVGE